MIYEQCDKKNTCDNGLHSMCEGCGAIPFGHPMSWLSGEIPSSATKQFMERSGLITVAYSGSKEDVPVYQVSTHLSAYATVKVDASFFDAKKKGNSMTADLVKQLMEQCREFLIEIGEIPPHGCTLIDDKEK